LTIAHLHIPIIEKESEKIKDAAVDMIDAEIMDMEDESPKIHPPKEQKEVGMGNIPSFLNSFV